MRVDCRNVGACWVIVCLALAMLGSVGCGAVPSGRNVEGVRLFQQGQYQQAVDRFQQALKADPSNADAYYNLAATYHRLGRLQGTKNDLEQSERYYNQALDHNPNHIDSYRGLAVLLTEQNRSADAFRLLEGWIERQPSVAEARVELARLHEEFGNKEAAKEHLLEALSINPEDARALAALGSIHEKLGNPQQALADYQRALWHDRFQPEVAARVAALQAAVSPTPLTAPTATADGSSRGVNINTSPLTR